MVLTSTAFQPLYGQTANIFGRRYLTLTAVALFTLGSGISGGAGNTNTLIVGRAIQGVGGGGINMMIDLIICDIVPLRERGKFMGMLFAVFSIGTGIGPWIGGIIVTRTSWRFVFYINLPIGGLALVLLVAFLQVGYKKEPFQQKIKRIDFIGNAILVASIVAVLFALTYGGTRYSWSSWRIIIPLVLGFVGMAMFFAFEASKYCIEPTTPPRLFKNRTSATGFVLTFLHAILTLWVIYLLPIYFQAVLGSTAARSGVQLLPTVVVLVPLAAVSGVILTKTGRYRPLHFLSFALMTLGLGLFTLFNGESSTAKWVIFQAIHAAGSGIVLPALLPGVQADLPEFDTATATGTWAFTRSFGAVWGVAIPAAIFNNRFSHLSYRISDPTARALLGGGNAYSHASREFVNSFGSEVKDQIISVYSDSLKLVWEVAIAFAGLAFLLVFIEKEIKLRKELDTEFGLKEKKKGDGNAETQA
jgi:hypothetical protein